MYCTRGQAGRREWAVGNNECYLVMELLVDSLGPLTRERERLSSCSEVSRVDDHTCE